MTLLFVVALVRKNNGFADVGYGLAFLVVTYATVLQVGFKNVHLVLLLPVTLWALRLSSRIYLKNKNKPEDFRYKTWRENWGSTFVWRSYLQIYMLQGSIVAVIASPILVALLFSTSSVYVPLALFGLFLWVIGFLFESIADYQLDTFIKNPENKGKIMMSGLWHYSRHPNYFGESMMWFGLWILAISFTPVAYLTIVSPLLITFLLLKVSGVPLLEKRWEGNTEWEVYKKHTPVFLPFRF
jgi:steroid 5-alpha reductase family enzyme